MSKEKVALSIWDLHRAPDLHGYLKEPDLSVTNTVTRNPIDRSELKDLFDLMELARLFLIKMLSLEEKVFHGYCQIPIPRSGYISKDEKKRSGKIARGGVKEIF